MPSSNHKHCPSNGKFWGTDDIWRSEGNDRLACLEGTDGLARAKRYTIRQHGVSLNV